MTTQLTSAPPLKFKELLRSRIVKRLLITLAVFGVLLAVGIVVAGYIIQNNIKKNEQKFDRLTAECGHQPVVITTDPWSQHHFYVDTLAETYAGTATDMFCTLTEARQHGYGTRFVDEPVKKYP
jgi:hypothetical protein